MSEPVHPAPSLRPVEEIAADRARYDGIMDPACTDRLIADVEPLLARLAAADRENADLRGEVERLTVRIEGQASTISTLGQVAAEAGRVMEQLGAHGKGIVGHLLDDDDNAGERLRQLLREVSLWALRDGTSWKERAERAERAEAHLTAAQAQLAEEIAWRNRLTARLEAVRALLADARANHEASDIAPFVFADELAAALSAAPQPEPDENACRSCGIDNPVWFAPNEVWNAVMGDHTGFLCPQCFIVRAEASGMRPTAWVLTPEPPASDEPARCEHGKTFAHGSHTDMTLDPYCPGPAASGTPGGGA